MSLRQTLSRTSAYLLSGRTGGAIAEYMVRTGLKGLGVNIDFDMNHSGEALFVKRLLQRMPGLVCADVGANAGKYALCLAANGASQIHAFEPVPATFAALTANTGGQAAIRRINSAVGESDGRMTLHVPAAEKYSTLASRDAAITGLDGVEFKEVEVPICRLDSYCAQQGVSFGFVKIDVEGFELEVMGGARELLAARTPVALQFEFNKHHLHRRHCMLDFIQALPGYRLFRLTATGLHPLGSEEFLDNLYAFQNIVALRADSPLCHELA